MKNIIISLSLLTTVATATGETWSLDSCINYAIDHNLTVKSRDLERMSGELSVTEAKDRFLPTLNAGANQSWDFGRGLTSQNTYANRNTSMFAWNAQFSLPLFQGLSAIRQLRYSRSNLSMFQQQTEAAKDEVTLNVISYYLQTLYNQEMMAGSSCDFPMCSLSVSVSCSKVGRYLKWMSFRLKRRWLRTNSRWSMPKTTIN